MNSSVDKTEDISSILSSIQLASNGSKHKHKPVSRDFARENVLKLREIQKTCQKQRGETSKGPLKAFRQSDKYRDVPSRLSTYLETEKGGELSVSSALTHSSLSTASRSRSLDKRRTIGKDDSKGTFVKSRTNRETNEIEIKGNKLRSNGGGREVEPRIPKLFLTNNKETIKREESKVSTAKSLQLRRSTSTSNLTDKKKSQRNLQLPAKHQLGVVPKYLVNRQKEWREELERLEREAVDPTIPSGHHLLTDDKRRETLEHLQESERNILQQMASLPVCADTLRIQRRREELDHQLLETEEAIKIFSHSKVFIKDDE